MKRNDLEENKYTGNFKRRLLIMTVATQVKQTLATLKGAQGTLRMYSLQSREEESKNVYKDALETTNDIIKDLEIRLKTLELEEPQFKGD